MKYFCGVQATGRGHFNRYQVVKDILESAGHEVYGYATGRELPSYVQDIERFECGPSFFIRNNRIDLPATVSYNARHLIGFYRSISGVTRLMKDSGFHEAIIDFEPISVRAAMRAKLPFTILDNQSLALLPLPYPPELKSAVNTLRRFVRFYYGSIHRARRILTTSLFPVNTAAPNQQVIPPCVRKRVLTLKPTSGEHLLFYSSIGEVPPGLVDFARKNPQVEIRAYVSGKTAFPGLPSNVVAPDKDASMFLEDFASCRVFVANAGFESLAEALYFRKPMLIVPIQGQWEQQINAHLIRHFGIAITANSFACDTFETALRHDVPPSEEVREWVAQGRERLEKALLKNTV